MLSVLTLLLMFTPSAYAEEVPVVRALGDTSIESIIASSKSHAKADLEGKGASVTLTYSSDTKTDVLILFLDKRGQFDPKAALQTSLPTGMQKAATIDLRSSRAWSPLSQQYRFYFLSQSTQGMEFHDIEFEGTSILLTLEAIHNQIFAPEPYTPSSYHRLGGFRVFGLSAALLVGVVTLLVAFVFLSKQNLPAVLAALLLPTLVYSMKFSIDAFGYTLKHGYGWTQNGTYEAAGSLPTVGNDLSKENARVLLCSDGTSYAPRLLAYHLYPSRVVSKDPTHILVHKSLDWKEGERTLRCGDESFAVRKIRAYPDGSTLYATNT